MTILIAFCYKCKSCFYHTSVCNKYILLWLNKKKKYYEAFSEMNTKVSAIPKPTVRQSTRKNSSSSWVAFFMGFSVLTSVVYWSKGNVSERVLNWIKCKDIFFFFVCWRQVYSFDKVHKKRPFRYIEKMCDTLMSFVTEESSFYHLVPILY